MQAIAVPKCEETALVFTQSHSKAHFYFCFISTGYFSSINVLTVSFELVGWTVRKRSETFFVLSEF